MSTRSAGCNAGFTDFIRANVADTWGAANDVPDWVRYRPSDSIVVVTISTPGAANSTVCSPKLDLAARSPLLLVLVTATTFELGRVAGTKLRPSRSIPSLPAAATITTPASSA